MQNLRTELDRIASSAADPEEALRRRQVIETLLSRAHGTIEGMMDLLEHGELGIRTDAAWVLGRLRCRKAVNALLSAVRKDPDDIGNTAAHALGNIGGKRVIRGLSILAAEPVDSEVRRVAAYALGWTFDRAAVPTLLGLLQNPDEDARVRAQAAESLGLIRDVRSLEALIQALSDPDARVRFWGTYALGCLGDARALPALEKLLGVDTAEVSEWVNEPTSVSCEAEDAIRSIRDRT